MSPPSTVPSVKLPAALPRRRWARWVVLGLAVLAVAGVVAVVFFLDPWLRRTLEKQVAQASHGRYELHVRELETSLWHRTATIRGAQLRTHSPDSNSASARLPELSFDLGRLRVAGIGLGAVLRRRVVPIDSIVLDSVRLRLGELPKTAGPRPPLYQQLPLGLPGLRLGYVAVRRLRARYGPSQRATAQVAQAAAEAHDVLLSAAGAADTTRLGYARTLTAEVHQLLARVPGHVGSLGYGRFASSAGVLALDSLRLVPLQPVSNQRSPAARIDLTMPHTVLRGLASSALTRGQFRADSLLLQTPTLLVTLPGVSPPPPHELLAPYFRQVRLRRLRIADGQVHVLGLEREPAARAVQLTGTDLRLTAAAYGAPGYLYYARAWQLRTGPGRMRFDAPYYFAAYQTLEIDTQAGRVGMTGIVAGPTMSVAALARSKGHQAAHVRLRVATATARGLDLAAILREGNLLAQAVVVRHVRVVSSSDGRFAINPEHSVVTPESIGKLPFRVDVRRLHIADVSVRLSYRSPRSSRPGVMAFQNLTGTLRNISNDPRHMSAAHPMTGEATGQLQKRTRAHFTLQANVLDPAGRHTVQGSFSAAPLAILNPMILPTRGMRFRSGTIRHIRFRMQLSRTRAQGTMWASYRDLKLTLLNRQNKRGLLHRLETTLVNGIVLRDNNPRRPGGELKTGRMTSARELRYSVFTLWRQGLVSGLLNSAGVPAPLAKKLSEGE